jgi:four helix bundle protein
LLKVETQVILAQRLGYRPHEQMERLEAQSQEVLRMLNALISKL